jgi:hypothetical protein
MRGVRRLRAGSTCAVGCLCLVCVAVNVTFGRADKNRACKALGSMQRLILGVWPSDCYSLLTTVQLGQQYLFSFIEKRALSLFLRFLRVLLQSVPLCRQCTVFDLVHTTVVQLTVCDCQHVLCGRTDGGRLHLEQAE